MSNTDTTTRSTRAWWTIVSWGSNPAPARGPWRTEAEAEEAVERFRARYGASAGTYEAAGSVRIVGPYPTRRVARRADISDSSSGIYVRPV